ncbi:metal-dependent hydrolase [Candidatus Dependentiae bacterium]|nr:metal-dependent hydrolase [Candidatus Dependentiae bacterium]
MPSYRVHLVGGFVTYLGILQLFKNIPFSGFTILQGLIFCLLGALFPDIDVKSKGQKIFYSMLLVLLLWLLYKKMYCLFAVMSLLGIIPILVRHRGIFHHIWFLFSMVVIFTLVIKNWCGSFENMMLYNCWFFFAGTISHVFLDRFVSNCKRLF